LTVRALLIRSSLLLVASCATTRYEEFVPPQGEQSPDPGSALEQVVISEDQMLSGQVKGLKQRLSTLEQTILMRLDQVEAADGDVLAQIASLSDQIQELRKRLEGSGGPLSVASPSPAASRPAKRSPSPLSANDRYEKALQAFDEQQYQASKGHFTSILEMNPRGSLADNAQYWLGECAYAVENYTGALEAFKHVFQYHDTEKDDDAQLKLGYCYLKLRDTESALIEFKRLIVDYPESEYLTRAEEQIRRIRAAQASKP
jgi:tol-pal system protein YbgF